MTVCSIVLDGSCKEKDGKKENEEDASLQPPLDRELADKFLSAIIPVCSQLFQQTLVASIRRSAVTLMRKCVGNIGAESLENVCKKKERFAEKLVEVLASVLDQEDDEEAQNQSLQVS